MDGEIDEFGGLLREHRRGAGLTQAQLAEAAGLSERGIQNIERGVRRPYPRTVELLVAALKLTPGQGARLTALATRPSVPASPRPGNRTGHADNSASGAGERKPATVLCARVANLPLLRGRLAATVLPSVVGGCLEIVQQAVERHGGAIERADESGLMAVFGVPTARQDHAGAAVRAAISIRADLVEYRARVARSWGVPLTLRIGLDSGILEVSQQGRDWQIRRDGRGSPLETAAVIERHARPDAIWAGPATRQAAGDAFVWREVSAAVSGAGRLSELADSPAERTSLAAGHLPIVGRLDELARIRIAWEEATDGRGQIVSIVGEAGIGKSRLLQEVTHRLDAEGERWLAASCFAHAEATAYLPFRELVRACLDLAPGSPRAAPRATPPAAPKDTRGQIAERLTPLGLDAAAAPYLDLLLGARIDDPLVRRLSPALLRTRTIEAVVRVLLATADQRPLAIFLEDVHWIDDGSEAILAALVESLRERPLLVVLTARTEGLHPWSGAAETDRQSIRQSSRPAAPSQSASIAATMRAIGRQPQATRIDLGRLSQPECRRLVEQTADRELPNDLVRQAAERAAGIPLFAVALSRALTDEPTVRGRQQTDGGKSGPSVAPTSGASDSSGGAPLPATVRDVLLARVDRLPGRLKRVLQTAAVVGPEPAYPLLAAVLEPGPELESALVRLEDLGFLNLVGLAPERRYAFDHVLMQVVVYETLLPETTRRQHERVGRAIETVYTDRLEEQYELLAHHYARGADDEKAVEYLTLASRKAAAVSAVVDAYAYFEAALARLDRLAVTAERLAQRAELVIEQFPVMLLLGRLTAYHALLRESEPLVTGLGQPAVLAAYYIVVGACEWAIGELPRARETLLHATRLASTVAGVSDEVRAMADVTLQRCELDLGHYESALQAFERARPTVDRLLNLHWYLWSRTGALWTYGYQGRWEEARAVASDALRVGEELDDRGMQSEILLNLAIISMDQGDPDRANVEVRRALELAPTPALQLMAEATAGWVACCSGQGEVGLAAQERASAALDEGGLVPAAINIGIGLGEALLAIGQTERARAALIEYGERARRAGMRFQRARADRLLGQIALAAGDESGNRIAAEHLERCIRQFGDLGAQHDLALARATYGQLLMARGEIQTAHEHLSWAAATLTRLGALTAPDRIGNELASCLLGAVDA